jgi:hypothetical protein
MFIDIFKAILSFCKIKVGLRYTLSGNQIIIDKDGEYTIDRDITYTSDSGDCIRINEGVSNVKLHLRSKIVGTAGSNTVANGLYANKSTNITILNESGDIQGFSFGILFNNCSGCQLLNVSVHDCLFHGVTITGDDILIDSATIQDTGGSTVNISSRNFGINVTGSRVTVQNCLIDNVTATEEAVGISITYWDGPTKATGICSNNMVRCNTKAPNLPNGMPGSYGFWASGNIEVQITNNKLINWVVGITVAGSATSHQSNNIYI